MAEACGQYLLTGSKVFIEGKIQSRSWDDKNGVKKYSTEIIAQNVKFLGQKKDREPVEEALVEQGMAEEEIPV